MTRGRGGLLTASLTIAVAGTLFVLAAFVFPGGDYNPCLRMLSALGRTEVRLVERPWSSYLFAAGMVVSALGVLRLAFLVRLSRLGAALNAGGLMVIALVPENVSMVFHNAGCWLAAVGGGLMLVSWWRTAACRAAKVAWSAAMLASLAALGGALLLHGFGALPFAPYVPTAQKLLILSFALWLFGLSLGESCFCERFLAGAALLTPVAVAALLFGAGQAPLPPPDAVSAEEMRMPPPKPLSDDEHAGLAWLEYVTGPLSPAEEKAWWSFGGRQFSPFAKRYAIAFAGYAAALIGSRGDAGVRARVGGILGHCVERLIQTDIWAYSQAKRYWGRKPWAPDPCYRENVMYTGHLLQILAYYEWFTGDRRYHRAGGGWNFVWRDGRRVHYDVEKLIGVTVEQMRKGPNGGIACEPGLMFFACNNHPHVALDVFARLGYGDWSADAARWEKWALAHLLSPALGGGCFNLVYHVRGNFAYPRGQNAFDGWSLLWYEAWAADRRIPHALWRRAAALIDWPRLERADDVLPKFGCENPEPAPASVTAVFLAAAARACGDPATAERLEKAVDARYLRRERGWYWLDVNREWRIGASAMRLIALAEANGSSFNLKTAVESWRFEHRGMKKGL